MTVAVNNGLRFNTNGGAVTTFSVGGLAGNGNVSLMDGSHVLTLNVGGNGSATVYGGLLSGSGGLTKTGSGNLDLCGGNSYTGATSVVSGELTLDFSQPGAPAANIINNLANSSSLALGGGTLAVQGNPGAANSQCFAGLAVQLGCSVIVLSTPGTGNPVLLGLGNISRSPGSTVDFTLPGGTQSAINGITTTVSNTNGILGSYATVNGTDWACSTGTAGNVMAYSAYTGGDLGGLSPGGMLNVSPSGPQSNITAAETLNTLNLTYGYGVTMTGTGSLTLAGGGLIGDSRDVISGGTLEGSSGTANNGELVVITPVTFTIGSVIADNGGATALTKAGAGKLILTGSNTYSGVTTISAGAYRSAAAAPPVD